MTVPGRAFPSLFDRQEKLTLPIFIYIFLLENTSHLAEKAFIAVSLPGEVVDVFTDLLGEGLLYKQALCMERPNRSRQ